MLIAWEINRYARCYSDSSKQCLDSNRKNSIFQYFAHLDTQKSQIMGNFWSVINSSDFWKLNLLLNLNEDHQIQLTVIVTENNKADTSLEELIFPKDFVLQFKLSARKESIGFRYVIDGIFFKSEYECHLCFDSFSKYGLLSGHWSDPFQFIGNDFITKISTNYDNSQNMCTPENTIASLHNDKLITSIQKDDFTDDLKNEGDKQYIEVEDPDITQLEIDVKSTSITNTQNIKKRQLILTTDNLDYYSFQSDGMNMANLGSKESGLFKAAIQFYENKEYKLGLKNCDQILKKTPDHGGTAMSYRKVDKIIFFIETLALKGLFLLFLGKRDEGFEICKNGLKISLQSHISWHILGLMHRQDKNYEESIKCYKNALKIDKDNFQIIRDMALLQLQCRHLEGAIDSRRKIIFSRPSSPFNWISMVIVYHLSGNLNQALEILDIYLEVFGKIKDISENHYFYKVSIMMELGMNNEAIQFLKNKFKHQNTRRYLEVFADATFGAHKYSECEEIVRKLLEINPDCREYISQIIQLYKYQKKDICSLFDQIKNKSLLAAVEMLSLVDLDIFEAKIDETLAAIIKRGSPATFQLFKENLKNKERCKLIWDALLLLDQNDLTVMIFKAKYYSFIGDHTSALELIDSAIISYKDLIELVMIKAHIQKHMGSIKQATETIYSVSESFMKDKFTASKSAKYFIRYGSISKAQEILGSFIQKPNLKDRMDDLHEMQAVWYLIEMADRLLKEEKTIYAACFYRKIELIFEDFIDDQLDFHGYSLRRMAFVEYIKFLRFLDNTMRTSEILKRAHLGLSQCILVLTEKNNDNDIEKLTTNLEVSTLSIEFEDDLSTHLEHFRKLLLSKKGIEETLLRLQSKLLSSHPEDLDVMQICLKISLRRDALLSAQKLSLKLLEQGCTISDNIVELINVEHAKSDSLWQIVPQLYN